MFELDNYGSVRIRKGTVLNDLEVKALERLEKMIRELDAEDLKMEKDGFSLSILTFRDERGGLRVAEVDWNKASSATGLKGGVSLLRGDFDQLHRFFAMDELLRAFAFDWEDLGEDVIFDAIERMKHAWGHELQKVDK